MGRFLHTMRVSVESRVYIYTSFHNCTLSGWHYWEDWWTARLWPPSQQCNSRDRGSLHLFWGFTKQKYKQQKNLKHQQNPTKSKQKTTTNNNKKPKPKPKQPQNKSKWKRKRNCPVVCQECRKHCYTSSFTNRSPDFRFFGSNFCFSQSHQMCSFHVGRLHTSQKRNGSWYLSVSKSDDYDQSLAS